MKIKDIVKIIERKAPLSLQESWDNCGFQVGNGDLDCTGVVIALDMTLAVLDEAIALGSNLIVIHHPMIFKSIKRIVAGAHELDDFIIKAIKHDVSIYAAHTNLDSMIGGVSYALAHKLGLTKILPMSPTHGFYYKLVVFVPQTHEDIVSQAVFAAGAGHQGNYDLCSFKSLGVGTFRPNEDAQPFIGNVHTLEQVDEVRLEFLVADTDIKSVEKALLSAHPYEEPAYDWIQTTKSYVKGSLGVYGEFDHPISQTAFLSLLKKCLGSGIKFNRCSKQMIQKVALCGGSGAFLISKAAALQADAYVCGDVKYHEFFGYDDTMLIADVGHYETEQFCLPVLLEILQKELSSGIPVQITTQKTNPINYI